MVSRSELISRMLSEHGEGTPFRNNRSWSNKEEFLKDNLKEVEEKLKIIDNCIWGKLIVMERDTRIAKAYLRSASVNIDGSCHEFDGSKLGLGAFTYLSRNIRTFHLLSKLGQGIDIYVDFLGNGKRSEIGVYKEKIFDLRQFKQKINENGNEKEMGVVWIQIIPARSVLESPLWPRSPGEQSIPRWNAPRTPDNHYEQCSKNDSVNDREEGLYSLPEVVAPCSRENSSSSPSTSFSGSSCSQSIPSTESTRVSRFTQHEREVAVRKRGGVRKRLEKSLGPPLEKSHSLTNLSSSIIDLRTLSNMKRPVYFQKPVTSRRGSGHFFF